MACTIQGMEASVCDLRAVPDVMEPRRRDKQQAVWLRYRSGGDLGLRGDFASVIPPRPHVGQQAARKVLSLSGFAQALAAQDHRHATDGTPADLRALLWIVIRDFRGGTGTADRLRCLDCITQLVDVVMTRYPTLFSGLTPWILVTVWSADFTGEVTSNPFHEQPDLTPILPVRRATAAVRR